MISSIPLSSLFFPLQASAHIYNGLSFTILIGSHLAKQKTRKLVAEQIFT